MKTLLASILLLYTSVLFSQPRYLVPYRDGNLWGYADTNLKIVISPKYDEANSFFNGLALVKKDNRYGVLNTKGREIIPPQYDKLSDYYNEYVIATKGDTSALIRMPSGKFVLPPIYKNIYQPFSTFFIVTARNSLSGVLNATTGKWLIPVKYTIEPDQFPWFIAKGEGTTTYFTVERGKFIKGSPPRTEEKQSSFDNLPPPVEKLAKSNSEVSYHTTPAYDSRESLPKTPWINIVTKNGKAGVYSSETYNEIVPLIYDRIEAVPGINLKGLFIAKKDGNAGVITGENKEVVPFVYEEIRSVDSSASLGFYVVKKNGKYGLIKDDKLLVPCAYDNVTGWDWITLGFALYKDEKYGMYVYHGQYASNDLLIEPKYDIVWSIHILQPNDFDRSIPYKKRYQGKLIVWISENRKTGYIDLNGNEFFRN